MFVAGMWPSPCQLPVGVRHRLSFLDCLVVEVTLHPPLGDLAVVLVGMWVGRCQLAPTVVSYQPFDLATHPSQD